MCELPHPATLNRGVEHRAGNTVIGVKCLLQLYSSVTRGLGLCVYIKGERVLVNLNQWTGGTSLGPCHQSEVLCLCVESPLAQPATLGTCMPTVAVPIYPRPLRDCRTGG